VIEALSTGGPVMVPILLCSVVAAAVFLERMWALRRGNILPHALCVEVLDLLRQGRPADALTRAKASRTSIARVLVTAIGHREEPVERLRERVEEAGRQEAAHLERFLPVLGTVAAISPLLGLLGTVGGMIVTFAVIQDQGMGNVASLAGGISQALITTFAGLCVGIPALVAHRFLLSKVDRLLLDMEAMMRGVLDAMPAQEQAS